MVIKGSPQESSRIEQGSTVSPQEETGIRRDVKAINTTIMLLSQKINFIVKNEKILSKNILVLNEKIRKVDEKAELNKGMSAASGTSSEDMDTLKASIEEINNKIKGVKNDIESLKSTIEELNSKYASKAEVAELKYLIDTINPLEFVTYRQLREYIKK